MTEGDLPSISRIVCGGYRSIAEAEGYSQEELDFLIAKRGSLEAIAAQSREYTFWVAADEGVLTGVAAIRNNELTKLYVESGRHRRGIGTMLFKWAEKIIGDAGFAEMILGAFPKSAAFYEKMGMLTTKIKIMETGPLRGHQIFIMHNPLRP